MLGTFPCGAFMIGFVSKGFVRNKADKLMLVQGSTYVGPQAPTALASPILASHGATAVPMSLAVLCNGMP